MSGNRTTICLAPSGRPGYLARLVGYLESEGFSGRVIVADRSGSNDLLRNAKQPGWTSGAFPVECVPAAGHTKGSAFALALGQVCTEFAVCCEDSDFIVPASLDECEQFLDGRPDCVAARGAAANVHVTGLAGLVEKVDPFHFPDDAPSDPIERLDSFFVSNRSPLLAVHRTPALREAFKAAADMPDDAMASHFVPGAASAILGKCAAIEGLYLVRQADPRSSSSRPGVEWLTNEAFAQSFNRMALRLTALAMPQLEGPIDEVSLSNRVRTLAFNGLLGAAGIGGRSPLAGSGDGMVLDPLLDGTHPYAARFKAIYQALLGMRLSAKAPLPKLLLLWGNPYVFDEVIAPILPGLAERFAIVLVLVDYRLSARVLADCVEMKRTGMLADVLVAPSHGGSIEAHLYMRNLVPALKSADFDVFLGISAMQPCEHYAIDCALPSKCIRVVFWPHPTNLFMYPLLGDAVNSGDARSLAKVVNVLRRRIEPSARRELLKFGPGGTAVWRLVGAYLLQAAGLRRPPDPPGVPLPSMPSVAAPPQASGPGTPADTGPVVASQPTLIAGRLSLRRRIHARIASASPLMAFWALGAWRMVKGIGRRLLMRPSPRKIGRASGPLAPWLASWPSLRAFPHALAEQHYPHLLDRYVYPGILAGRFFALKRLDWITQLGTDQFDACLMFNEEDARLHKILYGTPNVFAVKYVPRANDGLPQEAVDAILMPFTLHSKHDLTDALLETYRRDLAIALKESGAKEVHVRPHPGAIDNWLGYLTDQLHSRGVPCRLVSAGKSVTEQASSYKGVFGAVSGALRDTRLACPHIFVAGSVGLSLTHYQDPKKVVGFSGSIGWIEADGTYDPRIFQPAANRSESLPTAAEAIIALHDGRWERIPERLLDRGAA